MAAALALALGAGNGAAGTASIRLFTLGAAGGALLVAGATAHAAIGTCRLRAEPLTERQALALVTVEDAASYLGIAAGGFVVAATVVAALVGLVSGWPRRLRRRRSPRLSRRARWSLRWWCSRPGGFSRDGSPGG